MKQLILMIFTQVVVAITIGIIPYTHAWLSCCSYPQRISHQFLVVSVQAKPKGHNWYRWSSTSSKSVPSSSKMLLHRAQHRWAYSSSSLSFASIAADHWTKFTPSTQQLHQRHQPHYQHQQSKITRYSFESSIRQSSSRLFATTTPERSDNESNTRTTSTTTSTSTKTEASDPNPTTNSLIDIDWLQDTVVEVLNELFDYKEVARSQALAKINKQQQQDKKKQKKPKNDNNHNIQEDSAMSTTASTATTSSLTEEEIERLLQQAVKNAKPFSRTDTMLTAATKSEFGDYQINAAMNLAQGVGKKPRDCAVAIAQALYPAKLSPDTFTEPVIAGPGFINLQFTNQYLHRAIQAMAGDANNRLAVPTKTVPQKIIVDFSSPNIAKEMHVGHLRSTIIGDTLCRVLEFCGHEVVRLNHVGDWGTQFGMLVEHLRDVCPEALNIETSKSVQLGDLVQLYKAAKKRFDVDEEFKQRARDGVVKLQAGNPAELAAWASLCAASRVEYQKIYDILNIKGLIERGESFYNQFLPNVVQDLQHLGMAVESDGATAVFLDGYSNRDGSPLPMIIQKTDGGYNYATTDLAAIRHRTSMPDGENAQRVLYVTDAGQAQHFEMVFQVARKSKFVPDHVSLEHVPFGLVQGADGKKFATRSGETVKLKDLLDEAVRIAGEDLRARNADQMNNTEFIKRFERVTRIVGIGAVKYADLSMNRESNYRFSYEKMLSLNGNTAPYMLYAYARICGIIRKAVALSGDNNIETDRVEATSNTGDKNNVQWPKPASNIIFSNESEMDLVRTLVKLPDVIYGVERDLYPNRICDYLFDVSQKFNKFYENCPVNNAETNELKSSRLTLCTATAGTIRLLLSLLGIDVVEKL